MTYSVYSKTDDKAKLVVVAEFGSYANALEEMKSQGLLFSMMNPESTFSTFVVFNRQIVATYDKGDLDAWTQANKGTGRYMKI
ncbi:hypothetical protein CNR33_00001 [Pseudomonas phage tabernarius]|uniref:Uncharacterized protein n=1 Tax=Pseudomonas phage tabernarius TaxID=2048978 RepID=A0A2H4P6N2_9CAUD|nr:hypothetical protein FDJ17_gp01 [Pseudomonas phage tabernarius]ATW57847.1 hypothetical protein CNR33_00001 [Pseudomonas phage tabernarius]